MATQGATNAVYRPDRRGRHTARSLCAKGVDPRRRFRSRAVERPRAV